VEPRRIAVLGALILLLPGCGGGHGWPDAQCRGHARKLAVRAESMVRHYHGSTVYPADMSYLGFRDGLTLFEKGRCAPRELGAALKRELPPRSRAELLSRLPAEIGTKVRRALAE
jgi:hypothetical protein